MDAMPVLPKAKFDDSITIKLLPGSEIAAIESIRLECGFAALNENVDVNRQTSSNSSILAAYNEQSVIGFVFMRLITSVLEIDEIGVLPALRRNRIGEALWRATVEFGLQKKVTEIWLEVRESNAGAIEFYLQNKFEIVGRRKRYYNAPIEDAILMSLKISDLSEKMNAKLDD